MVKSHHTQVGDICTHWPGGNVLCPLLDVDCPKRSLAPFFLAAWKCRCLRRYDADVLAVRRFSPLGTSRCASKSLRSLLIDQSLVAGVPDHDRENSPRALPKCSGSDGIVFTLPWIGRSRSGGTVFTIVRHALLSMKRVGLNRFAVAEEAAPSNS